MPPRSHRAPTGQLHLCTARLRRGRLLQFFREFASRQGVRLRDRRLVGVALALLAEALLVLVVISMAVVDFKPDKPATALVSVTTQRESDKPKAQPEPEPARTAKSLQTPRQSPPVPAPAAPQIPSPAIIPLSKSEMAAMDIRRLPAAPQAAPVPGKAMMGPPDMGVPGDSKRVGSAPNGEPMYAASWYREPYDDELSGYLSTASGPGWALIACRTVRDFRVEDCVGLDEYPSGSQIQRAVLAAAWQFRVRPPRRGGISRVGDWVRIRIDYRDRPR
jgi:protein TonB